MEEVLSEKEGKNRIFKNNYFIGGIAIFLFLVILFLIFYSPNQKIDSFLQCGDGTFEGYCSVTKPYFCSNETLIRNSSQCGCPESFKFSPEECLSEYSLSENASVFDYYLDGQKGQISFPIYPEVVDSLKNLSRTKIYFGGELPRRDDFYFQQIDNPLQSDYLSSLAVYIENLAPNSKDLQARIAVSLVQNIPYNESQFSNVPGFKEQIRVSRYPYQVLQENQGSCEGKSELLAFLLKKMGFGVMLFYFQNENHLAVGIKCPLDESYLGTGYCFIETTMPSPISFSEGKYLGSNGMGKLISTPEFIFIQDGLSLSGKLEDYYDSKRLTSLVNRIDEIGSLNPIESAKMNSLREKYNLYY